MSGIRIDSLTEAAYRLRNLGAWDNKLADAFQLAVKQIRELEEYAGIHLANDKEGCPTKITSWEDFEQRMQLLLIRFIDAGAMYHVSTASFIVLARLSGKWKEQGATPPTMLRVANFGTVVVEWENPGCCVMIDLGETRPVGEEKNFRKHKLVIQQKGESLF